MGERLTTRYICLAWKLGLHPTILAGLSSITSNLKKWVSKLTIEPPGRLIFAYPCYKATIYMYGGEIDSTYLSLA